VTHIGRLVGIYSAPDRDPRLHSICVAIEVQVAGDYHAQETEVLDIQAFLPSDIPQDQLSHDHSQQFQDYCQGRTVLA
jgi:8-oxo-dGTP diphosphatase